MMFAYNFGGCDIVLLGMLIPILLEILIKEEFLLGMYLLLEVVL